MTSEKQRFLEKIKSQRIFDEIANNGLSDEITLIISEAYDTGFKDGQSIGFDNGYKSGYEHGFDNKDVGIY
jgi:hypothetical protein